MLFNSPLFLFAFLPTTLLVVHGAIHIGGKNAGIVCLICASIVFYCWWDVWGIFAIGSSIAVNYVCSLHVARHDTRSKLVLWIGIIFNVTTLAYFKYTNFLLRIIDEPDLHIILPLAISFYTFQQIAFLVDTYRGDMPAVSFRNYLVSVLFFPHLIAGPLIHYTKIMLQFERNFAVTRENIAFGLPILAVGLVKKVAIADTLATLVTPLFNRHRPCRSNSSRPGSRRFAIHFSFTSTSVRSSIQTWPSVSH